MVADPLLHNQHPLYQGIVKQVHQHLLLPTFWSDSGEMQPVDRQASPDTSHSWVIKTSRIKRMM
jgi:hypothetical protein